MSEAITKASNFELLLVDPKEEQALEYETRILSTAKGLRWEMNAMFCLTKWSDRYKRLHRDLRTIIFDE